MAILGFSAVTIPKNEALDIKAVKEWFNSVDRGGNDCLLYLKVVTINGSRIKNHAASSELKKLLSEKGKEKVVWSNLSKPGKSSSPGSPSGYEFNFTDKKYLWNNEEIYVTYNEQTFLYRWLVRGESILSEKRYFIYDMRKRLGKDFLCEMFNKETQVETKVTKATGKNQKGKGAKHGSKK